MSSPKKEFDWFDRPGVRKGLWVALWASCILTLLAEVAYRLLAEGEHLEKTPFKYALIGFISCALMILISKGLGIWLKVPPGYYDNGPPDSNDE